MTFRFATEADCALILDFIRRLAAYEHMSDQVVATEALLREWICERKKAEVLFVCADERAVGFALFFHNFSTFLGRAGIYLEDLFVLPEHRAKDTAGRCSGGWRRSRSSADAAAWNGPAWIGTRRASTFTYRSAPRPWRTGRRTAWLEIRCGRRQGKAPARRALQNDTRR